MPSIDTSAVFPREVLDVEYAAGFTQPWLFETPDGQIVECETETRACYLQREYRRAHGFHELNGTPL